VSELFLLYLLGQVDDIKIGIFCLCVIGLFGGSVGWLVLHEEAYSSRKTPVWPRNLIVSFSVVLIITVFIPSRETILLMTAGKAVLEASRTDTAKSLASNSVKWLDGFVAEQAKKYGGGQQ
jgi:hypothetical protein